MLMADRASVLTRRATKRSVYGSLIACLQAVTYRFVRQSSVSRSSHVSVAMARRPLSRTFFRMLSISAFQNFTGSLPDSILQKRRRDL